MPISYEIMPRTIPDLQDASQRTYETPRRMHSEAGQCPDSLQSTISQDIEARYRFVLNIAIWIKCVRIMKSGRIEIGAPSVHVKESSGGNCRTSVLDGLDTCTRKTHCDDSIVAQSLFDHSRDKCDPFLLEDGVPGFLWRTIYLEESAVSFFLN